MNLSNRSRREIEHGRKLARFGAEDIWGWASPAGRIRAARRARLIVRAAGMQAGVRALEIGCGTGLFTQFLAETGADITAVDISQELLEIANRRGLDPKRVRFLHRRFEDGELEAPFDVVYGSSVLHHLDVPVALQRIHQLLRPGGVMVMAEPNMLNPQVLLQKNVGWLKGALGDSPDETAFVRWRLSRLMRSTGFTDVHLRPCDWLHPATPSPLIGLVRGLGFVFEKTPCVREFSGSLLIRGTRSATH